MNLYGHFSGIENLAYFNELAGAPWAASKGMRQKVGIAMALAKSAKALILDEPTSGLDPSASHEFAVLLRRFAESSAAVPMATHDLFRAKQVASRVGIVRHGKLVHSLTAAELSHTDLERLYLEFMES